jgi:hypothetical protein
VIPSVLVKPSPDGTPHAAVRAEEAVTYTLLAFQASPWLQALKDNSDLREHVQDID